MYIYLLYEMMTVHSNKLLIQKPSFKHLLFYCICIMIFIVCSNQVQYHSNFDISKVSQTTVGDSVSLPIIINKAQNKLSMPAIHAGPILITPSAQSTSMTSEIDNRFKRYELKDTKYKPQQHDLNSQEQSILYSKQPPVNVFDVTRTITIEDYQLLEIKNIRIALINPTQRFTFCINQIYMDSQALKRVQQRRLPLCLNPSNKYPFYFNFYMTQQKPIIFRTSIYFIISIYDGNQLVDQKIWPRQIVAKISANHLKLTPVQIKNCNPKNFTTIIIPNPHSHDIKVSFQNQFEPQKNKQKQVMIPAQRNFKMSIASKQSMTGITTRAYQISTSDSRYPKLYLPVYCTKPLQVDSFNIGILNTDRSVVEILVPVTSNAKQTIQIKSINVQSSSGTIQVSPLGRATDEKILSGQQHIGVCRLIAHIAKQQKQKTTIQIKVQYVLQSNPKQILQSKNTYKFFEVRNPLSLNGRRFIDVTKSQQKDPVISNIFPIRNNLNMPLVLSRVIIDQKMFKITLLKDRRQFIYPNQMRQDFSLQYIGPRQLKISPVKYVMMLQFNGNLFIPIEIVVYDHSLQCVYNNVQQKCQNLGLIDYGYFRNNSTKFRQVLIRNWNPVQKQIKIKLIQNMIEMYGMNCTMNIYGPFPSYQIMSKHINNTLYFYLKGNHFIIINIAMTPLKNCTSGQTNFQISTQTQNITKKLKFKVQNGTIALIPQILRIGSAYQQSVQYLNLVSTFSQPYKIKSTFVNNSNINIFFNNHSQIYENQWIGLALVYDPFQPNLLSSASYSGSTQTVHSTQSTSIVTPTKQHQNCCGNQFFINSFINSLYSNDYKRFTYVSVRVVTTTQLQANSTIIIDNTPPKMIQGQNLTISLINYNKNTNFNTNGVSNNNKDYVIKVKNIFKQIIKYRPIIVPVSLYQDTKQFVSTMRRVRKTYEDALFCVNNVIAVKHNFSPQMVKTLLSLDAIPQQITIQPLQNEQYYFISSGNNQNKKNNSVEASSNYLTPYVRRTVANGARVCYKMNITKYLKELIETHIFNDIAQSYGTQIFQQFVEKEMEFYHTFLQYLEYDEFYDSLDLNFQKYCNKSVYTFFRFCKQIGVTISPTFQVILEPGAQAQIALKASTKFQETTQSFYLVLLNNITKYEAHFAQVSITQPKLKIIKTFASDNLAQTHQTKQPQKSLIQFIKKTFTKKQLSKLTKIKQSELVESDTVLKKSLSSVFPIILTASQFAKQNKQSQYNLINRTFTLYNSGTIDINISHVGFDNIQNICQNKVDDEIVQYQGINLDKNLCKGFMIKSGQQKNITISLNKQIGMQGQLKNYWMYLYSWENYYLKTQVAIKGVDIENGVSFKRSALSFILAVFSFIYVILVIFKLKKQIDMLQQQKKQTQKFKIMSPTNYSNLGSRIEKRSRKLQPIPQDQIAIVKQIQQSRIKQFFNSSDESEIANRQHTQQQQPSNIQILNALKNDKNNISLSEESSIDFIDLNNLNKSNQNVQDVLHEQNESQQQRNSSRASGDKDGKNQNQKLDKQDEQSSRQIDDVESNFNEGDVVDYSKINQDYGWGDPSQERKKKQQQSTSYYNVFFSQNPLKKKNENAGLFPWMNDYQRPHYR